MTENRKNPNYEASAVNLCNPAEIVEADTDHKGIPADMTPGGKNPRKTRKDKGETRAKKAEPAKKRNRGQFFVCDRINLDGPFDRTQLETHLSVGEADVRVIQGREFKFTRKVQYLLKGI